MLRFAKFGLSALALAGCTPDYSPNTYASNAVQQANKVEPATVVGFRQVEISASGTVGAVSGGAAGGILGAQADGSGLTQALGAVGGGILGSLVGTGIEHATSDTTGWEYIVRKANGELLSVTQREKTPIALGQKVLVITGNQARIVPDYSAPPEQQAAPAASEKDKLAAPTPTPTPPTPAATASPTPLTPPAPASEVAPQAAMPITETKMPPETAPPDATPPETTTPTPAPSPPPAATDAPTTPPW